MRSWSFNIGASLSRRAARALDVFERGRSAVGRRALTSSLRAVWRYAPRGQLVQDPLQLLRVEVLVEVVVDLHDRRVHAAAEAFHLDQREQPVLGGLLEADAELLLARLGHLIGAAQPAWRRAADLQM